MDARKRLIALIDADGCIYNPYYRYLIHYLVAEYGPTIYRLNHLKNVFNSSQIESELQGILDEILEVPFVVGTDEEVFPLVKSIFKNIGFNDLTQFDETSFNDTLAETMERTLASLKQLGAAGKKIIDTILVKANAAWFVALTDRMQAEHFDAMDVVSGSNRQSKALDDFNKALNITGSFFADLPVIRDQFNTLFLEAGIKAFCQYDGFVLADIFGECEPGESCQKILEELAAENKESTIEHAHYVFDKTKFSLLYGILHYLSNKYPHEKLVIPYFEDMENINASLAGIFLKHPDFIPENIELEFWPYNGKLPANYQTRTDQNDFLQAGSVLVIKGTGKPDRNYYGNVKKIATMCGHDLKDAELSIDAAVQLDLLAFKAARVLDDVKEVNEVTSLFAKSLTLFDAEESKLPQSQEQIKEQSIQLNLGGFK